VKLEQLAFDISSSSGSSAVATPLVEAPLVEAPLVEAEPVGAPPVEMPPGSGDHPFTYPVTYPFTYPFTMELRRGGPRRRKVEGVLHRGHFVVSYPRWMAETDALPIAIELADRITKRVTSRGIDLTQRARRLARAHDLPVPASIEWSERQTSLWGSCRTDEARIRISARLADLPAFVLDYVIVHELAHLVHADHSPHFHALVARYPRAERAMGYLMALSAHGDHRDTDAGHTSDHLPT
jgi:Protein of unknown function DUF45